MYPAVSNSDVSGHGRIYAGTYFPTADLPHTYYVHVPKMLAKPLS